jgi:phosphoribosyl 1,2-cyclic phosphodiesterase
MRIISLQFGSNGNSIYVEAGGVRLLFDAGLSGTLVRERLAVHGRDVSTVDAVLLESNYDPEMLLQGSYPEFLKERIQGLGGHISNIEAAELLLAASSPRLQWACLAHLSHDNNTPDLALETHRKVLENRLPLHIATRYRATGVLEL